MARNAWWGIAAGAALAVGCGSGAFCSDFTDPLGNPFVLCPDNREIPICDDPGETAFFQDDEVLTLVNGVRAECTAEGRVVCPNRGSLRCVVDPVLPD